jgi:radical SAM protein with 4Fe4S-binding SPASM domain
MTDSTEPLARELVAEDFEVPRPILAVWELTMKCDQPCAHCGSRAGSARTGELTTAEILEVGAALARLGCREVALIGGEAYLRPDLYEVVAFLKAQGMRVIMQTGGRALTLERARALKAAGLEQLGVSIDGPARIHDRLRGNLGSHAAAMRALDHGGEVGLILSANTQINTLNFEHLPETCADLRARGIQAWQVQFTVAMGRAADRPEWILPPYRVVDVIDTLAALQREAMQESDRGIPFNIVMGNNMGYFGPHEQLLRSNPGGGDSYWRGCRAGMNTIGIESDGTVKGCPSLPTAPYAGGNVRELSIEQIWEHSEVIRFSRDRSLEELWGHCKTCYYGDVCRGGCSWTAHCTLGRRGNNPFCYYRVIELRKKGVRERLEPREQAPNLPYDFGRFEIVEEPLPEQHLAPATPTG